MNSSRHEELLAALALYRGDFLAGLEVRQAPLFEEWPCGQRDRLRGLAVGALQTLADQTDDPEQTIAYTRRLLALEPWRENAHRCYGLAILQEHGPTMFHSKELAQWTTITLAQCRYAQGHRAEAIQDLKKLLATVEDLAQRAKIDEILTQWRDNACLAARKEKALSSQLG